MTKLIVALDFHQPDEASALISILSPEDCILKIGLEMFTLFGPGWVKALVAKNYKVFLDLKFHDIPNTVSKACQAAAELGVWMLNVHALGGARMMNLAAETLLKFGDHRPLLVAVTVLTSLSAHDLNQLQFPNDAEFYANYLAQQAKDSGLDGVVCSVWESRQIKNTCGQDFITVTPGIRLNENLDDQARIGSVSDAVEENCDYIVVGRPVTRATDPLLVIRQIQATLKQLNHTF